jgi:choline dehydrogenase
MPESSREVDYVIVGAGSAGCALANRLSADPSVSVLVLEAGPADRSPYIHIPAALIKAVGNPALDWCHLAEPDPSRGGKVDLWPAGRVLGGSSSINGMLYVRGAPQDFDDWAALGNPGWSYEDVLPYFKRSEVTALGDAALRGRSGAVSVEPLRSTHPLAAVFNRAAEEIGIRWNDDYNGALQEGISAPQVTQRRGWRCSAARGYLRPIRRRANLSVLTSAQALRLLFEGTRCVGVEYRTGAGTLRVRARLETVLCAGALGSPRLLQLSGIGAGPDLQHFGIPVRRDLPGVGSNLCEHPEAMVSIDVNVRTYNTEINSPRIALHMLNFLLFARGPATSPYPHSVAFVKSEPSQPRPDVQIMLGPYAFSFTEAGIVPYERPALSAAINVSHPRARGYIALRSADPLDSPRIAHALLSSDADIDGLIRGSELCRAIFAADAFRGARLRERLPGPEVRTRDEWVDYLRRTAFLGYHPIGTCRMGPAGDPMAVVDAELRVRGIAGLRVADASIFPQPISGNTNAATMMIGEKAADLILAARRHREAA